jgi:hypothetical protein
VDEATQQNTSRSTRTSGRLTPRPFHEVLGEARYGLPHKSGSDAFADEDGGHVGVGAGGFGDDGAVGEVEAFESVDLSIRTTDGGRVVGDAHAAGADRVVVVDVVSANFGRIAVVRNGRAEQFGERTGGR